MTKFEKFVVSALALVCLVFLSYIFGSPKSQGTSAVAAPSAPASSTPVRANNSLFTRAFASPPSARMLNGWVISLTYESTCKPGWLDEHAIEQIKDHVFTRYTTWDRKRIEGSLSTSREILDRSSFCQAIAMDLQPFLEEILRLSGQK